MTTVRRNVITLICIAIATCVLVTWIVWSGGLPTGSDKYKVRAMVPSAVTLSAGANVRMAGVSIGRVTDVERSGAAVDVGLEVDGKYGPFPADSRVGVRLRSLVGENYLEVVPGSSNRTIADGGRMPLSRANDYVEIDEILSVLQGDTRKRTRALLEDLGATVGPRGRELNSLIEGASGVLDEGSNLAGLLDGDRAAVARLIDNVGVLSRSVAARGSELRSFARDARGTFSAIARRDDALRSVVDELPATLRQARSTSTLLRSATGDVAPVLTNVAAAVDDLDPAIRRLGPAAREGRRLTRELSSAAPALTRVLGRLETTATPIRGILPGVKRILCEAGPALDYLAPYAKDVTSLVQGMASATNYYDASGHAARLYVGMGADTPTVKASTAISKLLNSGIFQGIHATGWNPYPKPGQADDVTTGAGRAGPNDPGGSYSRVKASC